MSAALTTIRAVGGGDETDFLEHRHESGALADGLIDVVN
jgi:hypothetical protein